MARDRRPGRQVERTALAWHRTVLAEAAVAALLLRLDAVSGWRGRGLPAALAVLATVAAWVGGRTQGRTRRRSRAAGPRWPLAAVAAATTATAVAAAALALPPG